MDRLPNSHPAPCKIKTAEDTLYNMDVDSLLKGLTVAYCTPKARNMLTQAAHDAPISQQEQRQLKRADS